MNGHAHIVVDVSADHIPPTNGFRYAFLMTACCDSGPVTHALHNGAIQALPFPLTPGRRVYLIAPEGDRRDITCVYAASNQPLSFRQPLFSIVFTRNGDLTVCTIYRGELAYSGSALSKPRALRLAIESLRAARRQPNATNERQLKLL